MALDLAQRLLTSEALPQRAVEAALLRDTKDGVPFVRALLELYPQYAQVLGQELELFGGPSVDDIAPDVHLMAKLPEGMCSRLLGFPIGVTSSSGVVDVLAVNPLDGHVMAEMAYHLHAPVKLVRGRIEHVLQQLVLVDGLAGPQTARQDHSHMNDSATPEVQSAPPFPLTRLLGEGGESQLHPGTARGVAPQAAVVRLGARGTLPPMAVRVSSEVTEDRTTFASTKPSDDASPASNVSLLVPGSDDLQLALSELAVAEDPASVVSALVLGLHRVSKEVFIFSVRGGRFGCRARSDSLGQARPCESIRIDDGGDALSRAMELGQYLGPIAEDASEARFLAETYDEVCATRIDVSDRPALVILAAGFDSAYDVSLRSDHLARAASDALARIVLAKKK